MIEFFIKDIKIVVISKDHECEGVNHPIMIMQEPWWHLSQGSKK